MQISFLQFAHVSNFEPKLVSPMGHTAIVSVTIQVRIRRHYFNQYLLGETPEASRNCRGGTFEFSLFSLFNFRGTRPNNQDTQVVRYIHRPDDPVSL